jgi:hypothetical protein
MRGRTLFVLIVAASMAVLTWVMGWWGILLAASVVGFRFREHRGVARRAALTATLAWASLLLADAIAGPFARLSRLLAGVMGVPAVALLLATLLFPALAAWSAATVAAGIDEQRARTNAND